VRTLRDHVGSGRDPLAPVPAATSAPRSTSWPSGFLAADSFRICARLQRKLASTTRAHRCGVPRRGRGPATDFSLASQVIELQRGVIGQLMSDTVASRLLDSESSRPRMRCGCPSSTPGSTSRCGAEPQKTGASETQARRRRAAAANT
jgi:hypothetical protein